MAACVRVQVRVVVQSHITPRMTYSSKEEKCCHAYLYAGVGEQLLHMSGDGRGEELAMFTNVADAQRQAYFFYFSQALYTN
jgi:hypothetical protein